MARARNEVRAGYGKLPTGAHIVFLRAEPYGTEVIRILDGRMDFNRDL